MFAITQAKLLFREGAPTTAAVRRLKKSLQQMDAAWLRIHSAIQGGADPDIRYHFPRVDGGEMWSRWDMQENLQTSYHKLLDAQHHANARR